MISDAAASTRWSDESVFADMSGPLAYWGPVCPRTSAVPRAQPQRGLPALVRRMVRAAAGARAVDGEA